MGLTVKVTLTQEEIVEACREWAERHHGLQLGGQPRFLDGRYPESPEPIDQGTELMAEFSSASGRQ